MAAASIITTKMADSLVCSCVDASQKYEESSGDVIHLNIMEHIKAAEDNGSCLHEPHLFGQHWTILLLLAMNAVYLCCVAVGWFRTKTKTKSAHQDVAASADPCAEDTALAVAVNSIITSTVAVAPAQKEEEEKNESPEKDAALSLPRNRHLGFPGNRLVSRKTHLLASLVPGLKETTETTKMMSGNRQLIFSRSTPPVPRISPPLSPVAASDKKPSPLWPNFSFPSPKPVVEPKENAAIEKGIGRDEADKTDTQDDTSKQATPPVVKAATVSFVEPQSSNEETAEPETKAIVCDFTGKRKCEEVVFESPPPVSDSDKQKWATDVPLRKKIRRTFPLFWEAAKRWGEKEKEKI